MSTLLLNFINEVIERKLQLGYDMGKGCVNCEEEVNEILDQIIHQEQVFDIFQTMTNSLKKTKMYELGG